MGMLLGLIILIFELWFYKFALPRLRMQPKDTIWKSRNIMFFSQKLYRFINCVELVSPHHAARELVHSIRQGQIASLFQKSIKRVRVFRSIPFRTMNVRAFAHITKQRFNKCTLSVFCPLSMSLDVRLLTLSAMSVCVSLCLCLSVLSR